MPYRAPGVSRPGKEGGRQARLLPFHGRLEDPRPLQEIADAQHEGAHGRQCRQGRPGSPPRYDRIGTPRAGSADAPQDALLQARGNIAHGGRSGEPTGHLPEGGKLRAAGRALGEVLADGVPFFFFQDPQRVAGQEIPC